MGRSPCCEQDSGVKKGPWTPEEDEMLLDYITKHGHGSWRTLAKRAGLNRCGKSCRLRWANYLRPDIKRGKFTEEEERIIINLHSLLGNKWSKIASNLPGRTDNEIKNFWNTSIRKKLLKMGIDPETHKPRTDFNHLMNLTQLLGITSNLGNWSNPSLIGLQQGDHVTQQLAKLQLLQNMLALMNSSNNSFVNNMGNPNNYLLGNPIFNPFNSYLNSIGSNTTLQAIPPMDPVGGVFSEALCDSSQQWTNVMEGGLNTQDVHDYKKITSSSSHENIQAENQLPALVASTSSGNGTFIQMDYSGCNNTAQASAESPSNAFFDDWDKFLEDEANGSYWKEILDLTSTSASPNSW